MRDFAAGAMKRQYSQAPDFALRSARHALRAARPVRQEPVPDTGRIRGDALLRARLRVLRGAQRLGSQTVPEARVLGHRGHPPCRRQADSVHRPQPGLRPANARASCSRRSCHRSCGGSDCPRC
ncbi:MAG: hypothetical protein M0C28_30985 [Candidatus Moduliflexus flocculans]|nr:hypothetical protein [Candidatus Moduliflexus flocculans]